VRAESAFVFTVAPQRGDGRLTDADVNGLREAPFGGLLQIEFADCETYEVTVPSWLARWLVGFDVQFRYERCSRHFPREFEAMYDGARAAYVASEVRRIANG
jgi:hypothetical protein